MEIIKNPCFSCRHRQESKNDVQRWLTEHPNGVPTHSNVADPAPRFECKQHALYDVVPEKTKEECRDYKP